MKPIHSFKRGLAKVRRRWLAGDYERALEDVGHLLKEWPNNPSLLIMWADLIQLQEDDQGPSLEDAKEAYEQAIDLDDQSPAGLIELGKYLYAIEDDSKAATRCFAKAIVKCKALLKEALLGQAEALSELERKQEALACLMESYWLQSSNGKSSVSSRDHELLEHLGSLGHAE